MTKQINIGFLGSGGIAKAHAYALDALKYYYPDAPTLIKTLVASPTPESRAGFAERFGFQEALPPECIWGREDLDALFILGPNTTHTPQLIKAAQQPNIKRIYVEKPIGTSQQDIQTLMALDQQEHGKFIMLGFQYVQKAPLRKALTHWQTGVFGNLIHFHAEYLHSSYLNPVYRQQHPERLQAIPINGAAADLGSHFPAGLAPYAPAGSQRGREINLLLNYAEKEARCSSALLNQIVMKPTYQMKAGVSMRSTAITSHTAASPQITRRQAGFEPWFTITTCSLAASLSSASSQIFHMASRYNVCFKILQNLNWHEKA